MSHHEIIGGQMPQAPSAIAAEEMFHVFANHSIHQKQ